MSRAAPVALRGSGVLVFFFVVFDFAVLFTSGAADDTIQCNTPSFINNNNNHHTIIIIKKKRKGNNDEMKRY